ncbi:MAG TPA: hypothetical protein DCP28_21105 [Cytophagales bacterium]|nr:hypothetical protein [Cytophagales bacterium]
MKKIFLLAGLALLASCLRLDDTPPAQTDTSFDFSVSKGIEIDLNISDAMGNPLTGIPIEIWDRPEAEGGRVWFQGLTGILGEYRGALLLANTTSSVVVRIRTTGLPYEINIPIEGNEIAYSFQVGENLPASFTLPPTEVFVGEAKGLQNRGEAAPTVYMGSYDSNGVPDYLEPTPDEISAELISLINTSLPEGYPVPTYHPKYLDTTQRVNLETTGAADVWMTFVHEGAGWRNAVGYYTYPTGSPPTTEDDLDALNIIFPNASFSGGGGGLSSGDKVYLGQFDAGTTIGFVLFANAWNGSTQTVGNGYYKIFSDRQLNPESDPLLRQHTVFLYDETNKLFLIGFEDINRESPSCDQDFNDAVFYLTANPIENINTENVNPIDEPGDSDGDGVSDVYDEYPDDDRYAYNNFYPGEAAYGTLVFEDLWPATGDYDFNDLVLDYQFQYVLNPTNEIVRLDAEFVIQAIGAGFQNGFGFSTELAPTDVANVSGQELNKEIITVAANGTESGQSKAVIVAFDNAYHGFGKYGGFVNTPENAPYETPDTVRLSIDLAGSYTYQEVGLAPFNPFLIVNGNRGREVHLPSYEPTDLVDATFFGTFQDGTDPDEGIYYKSPGNLPCGMNLPVRLDWPVESEDIRNTHLQFSNWVASDGFSFMDWYLDLPGYRDNDKVYSVDD